MPVSNLGARWQVTHLLSVKDIVISGGEDAEIATGSTHTHTLSLKFPELFSIGFVLTILWAHLFLSFVFFLSCLTRAFLQPGDDPRVACALKPLTASRAL